MCAPQSALSLGSRIGVASLGCGPVLLFTAATRLLGLGLALALVLALTFVITLVFKLGITLAIVFTFTLALALALAVCGSEMFCPACL
jgi:hypothetical protein